jgi:hypothetical protein
MPDCWAIFDGVLVQGDIAGRTKDADAKQAHSYLQKGTV